MTNPQSEHKAASVPESVSTMPPGTATTVVDAVIRAPIPVPTTEKKKRRTYHWKAIAQATQRALRDRDLEAEKLNACLDVEMEAGRIAMRRVRFWRLVSLWLSIFAGLTLAALARVVL